MRIATWNVNSVKQRVPRLLPWLDQRRPDVVCLQETKLANAAFDELLGDELGDRGYEVALHGEGQWNGVAILSRVGLEDVVAGLTGAPVVAVPTSVGYGASLGGLAALLGMLNSCAPQVVVVNIDNGFGAGYAAALMNRKDA